MREILYIENDELSAVDTNIHLEFMEDHNIYLGVGDRRFWIRSRGKITLAEEA